VKEGQYKLIVDSARRHGAAFPTQADWLDFKAAIDAAASRQIDEARLAQVIRGFWGPFNQAQWDAIKAVLAGAELPAASPEGVTEIGLTQADFRMAADRLNCSVAQIRAVDEVESGGGWFTDVRAEILNLDGPGGFIDGPNLPKILFEAHIFDRQTAGKFRSSHPNLSSAKWNRALYVGGQGEWARLHRAMQLDRHAALMSASVGRYQVMGFNHKLAGFPTVEAFWDAMLTNEAQHLQAFVSFVLNSGLADELRAVSGNAETCRAFAAGYNGSGYAKNSYHKKIAAAFTKWSRG
jgi:hypothetical protein